LLQNMYFIVHSNYCKNYIFWHTAIAAKSGPTSVTYSCMLIYHFSLYYCFQRSYQDLQNFVFGGRKVDGGGLLASELQTEWHINDQISNVKELCFN
jgi:hypothetical protein